MNNITKNALEESLKKFLLQKPLDKITISDLTTDCGISRMAFYYHFKDIYDLVEWSCIEDASRALQGKKTYDTWQEGLQQIFEAIYFECVSLCETRAGGKLSVQPDLSADRRSGGRAEREPDGYRGTEEIYCGFLQIQFRRCYA